MPKDQKAHTAADKEKFEQFKRDHPEWYYPMGTDPSLGKKVATMPIHSVYYFKRFFGNYGIPFFCALTSAYIGVKGYLYNVVIKFETPYFQQYLKADLASVQLYGSITVGPWSMKGLFGILSDLFPLFGWRKKWWLVFFACLGALSWTCLAFLPLGADSALLAAFFFFFANCHAVGSDLLTQGQYAEKMRENPMSGADIVTWVWIAYFVGSLSATWIIGPFADLYRNSCDGQGPDCERNFTYMQVILISGIPMALQNAVPPLFNWLGETRIPAGERGFQSRQWYGPNRNYFLVALIIGISAVLNVIAQPLLGRTVRNAISDAGHTKLSMLPLLVWSIVIGAILIFSAFRLLPKLLAGAVVYQFLARGLYFTIGGVDQWYMAKPDCIPGGPNLSNKFVTTVQGTVEAVAGIAGTALFQGIMGDWTFRPCFWVTTLVQCIGALWDIFIFRRWNISMGIPDEVSLLVGNSIIREIVAQLDFMPGVVLTSKLCPKGAESAMYGILAGFANFGRAVGRNFGTFSVILTDLKFHEDVETYGPCNDTPLWYLTLVGQCLLPLITIPLTFYLIPDARLTGTIIDDDGNEYPPRDVSFVSDSDESEVVGSKLKEVAVVPGVPEVSAQPANLQYNQNPYLSYTVPSTTPMAPSSTPLGPGGLYAVESAVQQQV